MSEVNRHIENTIERAPTTKGITQEVLEQRGLYMRGDHVRIDASVHDWIARERDAISHEMKHRTGSGRFFVHHVRDVMRRIWVKKGKHPEGKPPEWDEVEDLIVNKMDALERIDSHDELTQLLNRDELLKFLAQELRNHEGEKRSLVVANVDIDFFTAYNAFGHDFGNLALQKTAKELSDFVHEYESNGIAARTGGEEMMVAYVHDPSTRDTGESFKELSLKTAREGKGLVEDLEHKCKKVETAEGEAPVRAVMVDELARKRQTVFYEVTNGHQEKYQEIIKTLGNLGFSEIALPDTPPHAVYQALVEKIILLNQTVNNLDESGGQQVRPDGEAAKLRNLRACRNDFINMFPFGSSTVGYIEVDASQGSSTIPEHDAAFIDQYINSTESHIAETKFKELFEDYLDTDGLITDKLTYQNFKTVINGEIERLRALRESDQDGASSERTIAQWEQLLDAVYYRRAGRLMDLANYVQERQKKNARGTVGALDPSNSQQAISLSSVDHEEWLTALNGKDEVLFDAATHDQIKSEFHKLEAELTALRVQDNEEEIDPRLRIFEKYFRRLLPLIKGGNDSEATPSWISEAENFVKDELKGNQEVRFFDHLTRSYNERYLLVKAGSDLQRARAEGESYSVASLDLDFFKAVNEVGGHFVGDVVLMKFAAVCRGQAAKWVQEGKTAVKPEFIRVTGGEEFEMKFPGLNSAQAKELLQELEQPLMEKIQYFLQSIQGRRATHLANLLDEAKEYVKQQGGNGDTFGSFTAGVLDVKDIDSESFIKDNKKFSIGIMRQIGDMLGERQKKIKRGGVAALPEIV